MFVDKPLVKYKITLAPDTGDPADRDYLVKWLSTGDTVCVRTKDSIYHGKGLFCAQPYIPEGTLIDHYHGFTMTSAEAHANFPVNNDTFLLEDSNVVVPHSHIPGRFCNDSVVLPAECEGDITYSRSANAIFEQDKGIVVVRALCDIAYGEEIIISYGPLYWRAICFELAGFADLPSRFQRLDKCAADNKTLARWTKRLGFAEMPDHLRLVKVERVKADATKPGYSKYFDHYLLRQGEMGVWRSAKQYALHMQGADLLVPDSVCACEVCQKKERSRNPNKRKRIQEDSGEAHDTAPLLKSSKASHSDTSSDSDGISAASGSSSPSTRRATSRQYALKTGSAQISDSPPRSPPEFVRKSSAHLPASSSRITFDGSSLSSPPAPEVTVQPAPPPLNGSRPRKVARKSCAPRPPASAPSIIMPDQPLGSILAPEESAPKALALTAARTPKSVRESGGPSAASPPDIPIPDNGPPYSSSESAQETPALNSAARASSPSALRHSVRQAPAPTAPRLRKLVRRSTKHRPAVSPTRLPIPENSTPGSPSAPKESAQQARPPLGTYRKFALKSGGHHPVKQLSPLTISDEFSCSPIQDSPLLSAPCSLTIGRKSIDHRVASPSPSVPDSEPVCTALIEALLVADDPPSSPVTAKVDRNPRVGRKASGHAPIAPQLTPRNPRVARKSSGHAPLASPEPILIDDEPLCTFRNLRVARKSSGHEPIASPEPFLIADEPLCAFRNPGVARKSSGHEPIASPEPFLVPDEPPDTPTNPRVVRKASGHAPFRSLKTSKQLEPFLVSDEESRPKTSASSSSSSPPPPCSSSSSPSPIERPLTTEASLPSYALASDTEIDIDAEIDQANIRAALAVAKRARNPGSSELPAAALAFNPAKDTCSCNYTADESKHAAIKCLEAVAARDAQGGERRVDGAACGATIYVIDKFGKLCSQCAFKLALAKVGRVVVIEGGIDASAAQVLNSLQIAVDETTLC
ncbi:hypothetical protein BDZ88DRAFT_416636 [Geranomyces variabilis]|nr:hypothetical protein BDZ88DRAFT_416636 [Geranomyces variabilis]KAJ3136324.1 hypothetical protein HDU90_003376 [Geranomyces variabilis]